MKELLIRWLKIDPVDATIDATTPAGHTAKIQITGSDRRRVEQVVDTLLDLDYVIHSIEERPRG